MKKSHVILVTIGTIAAVGTIVGVVAKKVLDKRENNFWNKFDEDETDDEDDKFEDEDDLDLDITSSDDADKKQEKTLTSVGEEKKDDSKEETPTVKE